MLAVEYWKVRIDIFAAVQMKNVRIFDCDDYYVHNILPMLQYDSCSAVNIKQCSYDLERWINTTAFIEIDIG